MDGCSGEGGIFQLTGRWNYEAFGRDVGMTAESAADYLMTPRGAFESACWFWKRNNLNRFADRGDIDGMSKAVNGGTIGLADRKSRWNKAREAMRAAPDANRPLAVGSRGEDVKAVQKALKTGADGIFGPNTAKAVQAWQKSQGLAVTGTLTQAQVAMLLA